MDHVFANLVCAVSAAMTNNPRVNRLDAQ